MEAGHLLFVGYDVNVEKGKGRSSGSRTLWPTEQPHCMAKSRTLADPVEVLKHDTTVWNLIFGTPARRSLGEGGKGDE